MQWITILLFYLCFASLLLYKKKKTKKTAVIFCSLACAAIVSLAVWGILRNF